MARQSTSSSQSAARKTTARRTGKRNGGGTLVGIFIGLVIGLACAFGVAWYLQKSPLPFQDKGLQERDSAATVLPQAPIALPGKPGGKPLTPPAEEKPRFEFYKILPSGQTSALPADEYTDPAADETATPALPVFYLQAGAFQKAVDADNLKAKLALMGLEAGVQEASVNDKTVFRVRVGPYATAEEMNRARTELSQAGMQATVVKVKSQ